jgi:hypothetical protein
MRPQSDGIDLAPPFVSNPDLQHIHGEYFPLREKIVVRFRGLRVLHRVVRIPDIGEMLPPLRLFPANIQTGSDPLDKYCRLLCDSPLLCNNSIFFIVTIDS